MFIGINAVDVNCSPCIPGTGYTCACAPDVADSLSASEANMDAAAKVGLVAFGG
jgi:hypothetical protein